MVHGIVSVEIEEKQALATELRELIECQYGLLDELLSTGVISQELAAKIRAKSTEFKQNDKLLDILRSRGPLKNNRKFLEALFKTFQGHIKSYILCGGGRIDILSN